MRANTWPFLESYVHVTAIKAPQGTDVMYINQHSQESASAA